MPLQVLFPLPEMPSASASFEYKSHKGRNLIIDGSQAPTRECLAYNRCLLNIWGMNGRPIKLSTCQNFNQMFLLFVPFLPSWQCLTPESLLSHCFVLTSLRAFYLSANQGASWHLWQAELGSNLASDTSFIHLPTRSFNKGLLGICLSCGNHWELNGEQRHIGTCFPWNFL